MNNIPESIIRLKIKSLYHTLDDEEARKLDNWIINNPGSSKEMADAMELFKDYILAENYSNIDTKSAWSKIRKKASVQNKIRKKHITLNWIRAAAAVFIAVFAISSYLLFIQPENTKEFIAQIKPGSPKATLELSDGNIIYLTNKTNFEIRNKDRILLGINKSNHFIFESDPIEEGIKTITVPYGGEYTIELQDKSIVKLNSGSVLKFPDRIDNDIRRVELEGEAYFEITKDKHKPFEVVTRHSVTRVLGTKFNVCSYAEDLKEQITLVEGKIEVKNNWRSYQVSPGEQYISSKTVDESMVQSVDVNLFVSWKDGIYRFQNMSLAEIIPKFERWYNVKFKFKDKECADLRFTGAAERQTNFSEFINLIESTSNVKFTSRDNQIIISQK